MSVKSSKEIVNEYLHQTDWRVRENSNSAFSFGGLNKYITGEISKDYWLREIYPSHISQAYVDGDIHIHDLGGLTLYCCGYSLKNILMFGVQGVPNIPTSAPAKHFDAILNQIANLTTVFQNEIMGAVAFNSFDTLLAPYVKQDQLNYKSIKQHLQNFIFSVNSNSRGGAEPAFLNITCDLTPSADLLNEKVFYHTTNAEYTYKDCQEEMDQINKAIFEIMLEGDAVGKPFSYPIFTYNIHKRFDWDNPNNDLLWDMAGKYGYPYFANYLNSDLNPEDARSMCCRLRLSIKELQKKNGGLFGAGDNTGSIGVVTINLPRLGYLYAGNKDGFYKQLTYLLNCSKDSLEIKRKFIKENVLEPGLLPAFSTYVGTVNNHFSTIGEVGRNEMVENFFRGKEDILTEEGRKFALEVGDFIRQKLIEFQAETNNLYNYEATPAESTSFRLARLDKINYPTIITRGTAQTPYYTNSCHIPVNRVEGIQQVFDNQEDFQVQYTGGTVIHIFMKKSISAEQAKHIVKTVCTNYKVPYVSISPIIRFCQAHGFQNVSSETCPHCNKKLELFQRITGYLRNVAFFNDGKKEEFYDRKQISESEI